MRCAHANGGTGGNDGIVIANSLVRTDALQAVGDAVADAEGLELDRGEVGEFLEGRQRGHGLRGRDSGLELRGEFSEDGGRGQDVVGSEREREAGGDGAGADHGLGVFDEAGHGFVEGREVGVEESFEDAGAAKVFLPVRAAAGVPGFHGLDLLAPFAVPAVCDGEVREEAVDEPVREGEHQGEHPRELLQYVTPAQDRDPQIVVIRREIWLVE